MDKKDEMLSSDGQEVELDSGIQALADMADEVGGGGPKLEYDEFEFNNEEIHRNGARYDNEANEPVEKLDFVKEIENFDLGNISDEDIEFMKHIIQDVFREHFPVDSELIDKIPDRMRFVDEKEFFHLLREGEEDSDINIDSGFYSKKLDQMVINISMHHTPGGLFSTMFHESLHFVSINSGAGLEGGFCYPGLAEDETDDFIGELDEGVRVLMEGTTHNITHAYVIDYLGFDPQPEMFGYESEYQVANAIWGAFSREERVRAYFNAPMELLRVRVESAFEDNYDVDKPTGIFANCLVNIGRAAKQITIALNSWRKDNNPEPVERVLKDVRHAVGLFIVRESEDGKRELDEEDLDEYLEPYKEGKIMLDDNNGKMISELDLASVPESK